LLDASDVNCEAPVTTGAFSLWVEKVQPLQSKRE